MASVIRDEIGLFGMRIDREMYRERFAQQAGEAVAADTALREAFDAEEICPGKERCNMQATLRAKPAWISSHARALRRRRIIRFPSAR